MKDNFVISIGRQYGSGGRIIGHMLSEMFGIGYYDKKLITEAAMRSGLSADALSKADEKYPSLLWHALSGEFSFNNAFQPENYSKIQSDTIKAIAERESCVIVGRCADYVLRDNPRCVNIFLHAPESQRIETAITTQPEISERGAAELLVKIDKARASYYNFYTDKRWGDSRSYHLCLDTSTLGMEASAAFIRDYVIAVLDLKME